MRDPTSRAATRLTSLYEAHSADVFRYALHITGRREDAEDVVQHVFLRTYSALEAGRELVNPRAWLIKAAKHRSLNLLRDRHDAPIADVDRPVPFAPDDGEAEALAEVRTALWSLPETQHHAFVLRHWSGLSQDEIADVLATTPAAVESLLVRARATLVAEREGGVPDCADLRGRLARMLAPTPGQRAHLAGCRRCRTAQTRLLRASEFATAFALVPSPHVLHALATAIPGFGASGAVAGASATGVSATGAAAGSGSGGAAASAVSAATKVGILTKVAVAATTAAVAVTAVHPLRTAVSHAIFRNAPASSASAVPTRPAAVAASSFTGGSGRAATNMPVAGVPGPPATHGSGASTATGSGAGRGTTTGKPGGDGSGKGKSGTAGSNGNGNGPSAGGASAGVTHGKAAGAPGRSKASGSTGAPGRGSAKGKSAGSGHAGGAGGAESHPPGAGAASGDAGGTPNGKGGGKP